MSGGATWRVGRAIACTATLATLACASPAVVMRAEAPALATLLAGRVGEAPPPRAAPRWLVVAVVPGAANPDDAGAPDLATRCEAALRSTGSFEVVGRVTLPWLPMREEVAARSAERGADAAIFVRLTLREHARRTHALRYLASAATFGLAPWAVVDDELTYALELVAVDGSTGGVVGASERSRRVAQRLTLWQTAEGDLLGWDVGELLGGGRRRRRALEAAVSDELLAEAVPALETW
jgi:hypothetical protein